MVGSDLGDSLREYLEGPQSSSQIEDERTPMSALLEIGGKPIRIPVTRDEPPADIPTRASFAPEFLEVTEGSLRLIVPSRSEYETMYGLLAAVFGGMFFLLWIFGALPIPTPLAAVVASRDPRLGEALLIAFFGLMGAVALGGALNRRRIFRRPARASAVKVQEVLNKYHGRVFLKTSDGNDTFWLCSRPEPKSKWASDWPGYVK